MSESITQPAMIEPTRRPAEVVLAAQGVSKQYPVPGGTRAVLDEVDFEVVRGQIATIVGPSGAGKTTLLRCMAGLVTPSAGCVVLDGTPVTGPPEGLAVVFQDYSRSLMPWMSVRHNVELPLRGRRVGKRERRERSLAALADVGLSGNGELYPWQLSGGMQQRVAIARALAYRPEALLMDEPFASVDAQTRADLEDLMLRLRIRRNITIVLVTHDIDEAVYLGDVVLVLGGSPTRVETRLPVGLGPDRDQIRTKAEPEFLEIRSHVLAKIRGHRGGAE
ncbi:MAG TPA: ABC transporter ATP-binding protein [Pseudonocardia sp.]|jgi:NitT/TauT family transport system ATP-binding protein|uniref:ABC transporter ATP-binding protein n=1 Tax=Pseudonocardia sp. TaxID=60912 RepID=UPI002CCF9940|nr:ABC transporter ATP-binding protein [Pseudonocardia sp.]HTF49741.1 ABC transporter ATP-binding protein [Pseudonocardia sp.]